MTARKAGDRPAYVTACTWQAVPRARAGKLTRLVCHYHHHLRRRQMEWAVSSREFRTHLQAKGRNQQTPRAKAKRALPGRICREQHEKRDPQSVPESSPYEKSQPGLVEHACYPAFGGLRPKDEVSSKPAWAIKQDSVSKEFV